MASDRARRDPPANASWSDAIPFGSLQAPSQRTAASTRSAFARFVTQPFTYGSRPAPLLPAAGRSTAYSSRAQPLDTLAPRNASYDAKLEIATLDISPDKTHAILAGRDILQTIQIVGNTCTESLNLRPSLAGRESTNVVRPRDALDIHDVKWSHGQFKSYIAGAASNGKIIIYDLTRPGYEIARLHEHTRQVHKVAFNPFQGHLLLSGSQDATVKLWDLRDTRSEAMTCRSRVRFVGASEGIRDLRWSPKDGVEFAIGTDNGTIQRWDYRYAAAAKLRISAHERRCTSIDWHPDGKHLLSASQDQTLKIWDFSSDARRQKAEWTLKTPFPIMNARWRPSCLASNDGSGMGNWQTTQVATSYERSYAVVHIWDFRRPHMPYRELLSWPSAPTDMVWHSQDLLWSVSRENMFYQSDVQHAPRTVDRRPLQTFAISPLGELFVCTQKRRHAVPQESGYSHQLEADGKGGTGISEKNEPSRSSFDDSVDDSFLSSSFKKDDSLQDALAHRRHHGRTGSLRSSKYTAHTSNVQNEANVVAFDEIMGRSKHNPRLRQPAFSGHLHGTPDPEHFIYIAQKAKFRPANGPCDHNIEWFLEVGKVFDANAMYYRRTGLYEQAQTWSLIGTLVRANLAHQAVHAWRKGLIAKETSEKGPIERDKRHGDTARNLRLLDESSPRSRSINQSTLRGGAERDNGHADLKSDTLDTMSRQQQLIEAPIESSSNVATPLAKPSGVVRNFHTPALPELETGGDQLALPESVFSTGFADQQSRGPLHQTKGTSATPAPEDKRGNKASIALATTWTPEHARFYRSMATIDDRKAAMGTFRPQPKAPLDFTPRTPLNANSKGAAAISIRPSFDRHNSDESFGMFSASSGSQPADFVAASYGSRPSRTGSMSDIPESEGSVSSQRANIHPSQPGSARLEMGGSAVGSLEGVFSVSDTAISEPNSASISDCQPSDRLLPPVKGLATLDSRPNGLLQRRGWDVEYKTQQSGVHFSAQAGNRADINSNATGTTRGLCNNTTSFSTTLETFTGVTDSTELFMGQDLSHDEKQRLLSQVSSSQVMLQSPGESAFRALQLDEILTQLKSFYTSVAPDPQILEVIARASYAALSSAEPVPSSEADKAVWLCYFDLLHRHLQAPIAMSLAKTSQAHGTETAFEWPAACTAAVNCAECDRPANNRLCSGCGRNLGPCSYCWERYCPFPWPAKTKTPRDLTAAARNVPETSTSNADNEVTGESTSDMVPGLLRGGLWSFCLACNHGVHAGCREDWRAKGGDMAGDCPFPGCDCPCDLRQERLGRRRFSAVTTEEVVSGEDRKVKESGAVKTAGKILESKKVGFALDDG